MTYQFFKNDKKTTANPIQIEKEKQTGFSLVPNVKTRRQRDTHQKIHRHCFFSYHEQSELVEHSMTKDHAKPRA